MKKIICVFLATTMFVSFAACKQTSSVTETTTSGVVNGEITTIGNGDQQTITKEDEIDNTSTISGTVGGNDTQSGWSSTGSNYTAEQMDSLYPTRKNIKGKVAVFTPFADDEYFKKAVDEFKTTYPDVSDVEVIATTNVARNEKLLSLINAGQSPDFVYSTYQDYPLRAAKGLTMPIDQYIYNHPGQSDALMNNNCSFNGKRYCVIIENPIAVLYYNTALFQRAGEKTPDEYLKSGDWTWATLRKVAKKLTDSQNGIYGFATDMDWYFSLCLGQDVVKFENGVAKLNLRKNQTYIDGHQVLVDMINVDKSTVPTHWIAHTEFAKGSVAMCFTALDHHTFFDNANMKTYDYTLFPKASADADYYSTVGGVNGGFSIAKGSKNIEGGMAFGEMYLNVVLRDRGNQTRFPKAFNLAKEYNVKKIVPWFYGYGLEGLYFQDFCGWVRTGTKDINTLIEENAPIMEAKLQEYQ
mgnify:CR=1 FL=1